MKRWKKVLLVLLVVFCLAAAALCFRQRNNIAAVYTFATKDSQEIGESMEKKREEHRKTIQKTVPSLSVLSPSTEQSNAILSGQTTAEQVKEELGITEQLAKAGSEETAEDLIGSCVAELYACKVDLMSRLAEMKQAAVDRYLSLPEEQQTETMLKEIGMEGLRDCYALEVVIDAQVQEILDRYRAALAEIGSDTSVMNELWDYYEDEKAAEKAYYMDQYLRD